MKRIVLCSDGTGNQGGYGRDSNVYKMYKAVNIHDAVCPQVAFYDNGVGTNKSDTNKNKYMTALSGAFGFGFGANVRDLYDFLARSYQGGDEVFLFGFSRGAATVRAFTGFLHACGLIDTNHTACQTDGDFDVDKFKALVVTAFKCYESKDPAQQAAFKAEYAVKNAEYAPEGNLKIKFIGVWDTVSALGFPQDFSKGVEWFFCMADKLSDAIWPHRFYDYKLNHSIENAYHALSIDDERTTFHPKVWNEHRTQGYVEQVWFAGVHSNVGGGYPRTGMSDLALEWMMSKAGSHGLEFYPDNLVAVQNSANVFDRLYDSRDGVAIYYRYGPRDLEKLSYNDENEYKLRGKIKVHASAYRRIKTRSAGYAPDGLPDAFDIVDIDPANPGQSKTLKTFDISTATPEKQSVWQSLKSQMKQLIDRRALLYRVFVELTLLILIVAGCLWMYPTDSIIAAKTAAEGGLMAHLADILRYVTPAYFGNFITYVVQVHPWIFVLMLAVLYGMNELRKTFTNELDRVCTKLCEMI